MFEESTFDGLDGGFNRFSFLVLIGWLLFFELEIDFFFFGH